MSQKKGFSWSFVGLAVLAVFAVGGAVLSAPMHEYRQVATILIPGSLSGGFDISWVDAVAGRYYLADRGTTSVDVIDTKHVRYLYSIPLAAAGNGVVAIPNPHDDVTDDPETAGELWVGDSASNVEVIDLKTKVRVASISTGGVARADEVAYDPLDHIVLIANDRETTCVMGACTGPAPFITFISTENRTVLGQIFIRTWFSATRPRTTAWNSPCGTRKQECFTSRSRPRWRTQPEKSMKSTRPGKF
jgi:hypothetical protein